MEILASQSNVSLQESELNAILEELAIYGGIEKLTMLVEKYLTNLSNRDYVNFDEKYIRLIFYCIAMNFKFFNT